LVLRERLRRIEVERPRRRPAGDGIEDGKVERERLPGRGAGRDDQVLAARRRLPRARLVDVEFVDSDRLADARVELGRERRGAGGARGLDGEMRELLALEQRDPGCELNLYVSGFALSVCGSVSPWGRRDQAASLMGVF
jgi:hypothetical protein